MRKKVIAIFTNVEAMPPTTTADGAILIQSPAYVMAKARTFEGSSVHWSVVSALMWVSEKLGASLLDMELHFMGDSPLQPSCLPAVLQAIVPQPRPGVGDTLVRDPAAVRGALEAIRCRVLLLCHPANHTESWYADMRAYDTDGQADEGLTELSALLRAAYDNIHFAEHDTFWFQDLERTIRYLYGERR